MPSRLSHRKISPNTKQVLAEKLHPKRFPGIAGKMAAIVGFVIGASFIEPRILEMVVTSDWIVLARLENEVARNHIIGHYNNLLSNWTAFLNSAQLTLEERIEAECLFAGKVGYLGREDA